MNKLLKEKPSTKKTNKILNLLTEIIESKEFLGIDFSKDVDLFKEINLKK